MALDSTEISLVLTVKENYRAAANHSGKWREEAREDYNFVSGDQWSSQDRAKLQEELRPIITFNRVAPIVEAVSGSEINNRQEVRFIPREVGDVKVNELFTGTSKWVRDLCDAEDEETDAFFDTLVCGMGWTETRLDYDSDPDGRILIERTDPLEMYWDPSAKKRNIEDSRWVIRVRDISKRDFREMWPLADSSQNPRWLESSTGFGEPHDATRAELYETDQSNKPGTVKKNHVRVVEYQWWQYETYYRVFNPLTSDVESLDSEKFERLQPKLDALDVQYVRQRRKVYYRAFLSGDTVLEIGPNPCQTDFTFKCITAKRDLNRNLWYGLVRSMKDPQRWANKFFSQILHIINSNAKGGLIAEEDAFSDPHKAEDEWARPDSITFLTPGALSGKKVIPKPIGQYPVGIDNMMHFAIGSMRDVTGVNLEMLGMAGRDQPGVLEAQRKQAGLNILGTIFNSLRRYRKEQGRVLLYFIRTYISDGRVVRITGDTGAQYVPLMSQDSTVNYDVVVDDSPTSPNQKEQVWALLAQMMPFISKMGLPTPPEVLDYMPLPSTLTEKWKTMLQAAQQKSPEDELQTKLLEAEVAKLTAEAQKVGAEGQRISVDSQKTGAEIDEVKSKSALNMARAQKEMSGDNPEVENFKAMDESRRKNLELQWRQSLDSEESRRKDEQLNLKRIELILRHKMMSQDQEFNQKISALQAQLSAMQGQSDSGLKHDREMTKIETNASVKRDGDLVSALASIVAEAMKTDSEGTSGNS